MFFANGNNGRYKNIYHVAMFCGTASEGFVDWWGNDMSNEVGYLLEARNEGVGMFTYYPDARNVVVIGRPTK